jgi:hypothetical protein
VNARLLVPVALLALVVLGIAWFVDNFEQVPGTESVGASGEARLRPFLAAERFATRMGMPAKELRLLPELNELGAGGVLLLPARRQALAPEQRSQVLAWVTRGGHAIVEAERPPLADPLLDGLNIKRLEDKDLPSVVAAELPGGTRPLNVSFNANIRLDAGRRKTLARVPQTGPLRLVSFQYGKGVLTVATRLDFARNDRIGEQDHAELLWELAKLTPATWLEVVSLMERLSLWRFLREHALPALLAGSLLLALWLWRIAPRFGPVPPDAPPARRRLLDHLRASGRYLWTEGLSGALAAAARDAALRRLGRAQPDFAVASPTEKAARLAALADVPLEDAQRFIAPGAAHSSRVRGADFMRLAAIAQRVHFALEKGSR